MLEDSLKKLTSAYKSQCQKKWEESWKELSESWEILSQIQPFVESQPQIQSILSREREILPNIILQNLDSRTADSRLGGGFPQKPDGNAKRYWTEKEHEDLQFAIQQCGIDDLRGIQRIVKTRNLSQIRSKLQKLKLKIRNQN